MEGCKHFVKMKLWIAFLLFCIRLPNSQQDCKKDFRAYDVKNHWWNPYDRAGLSGWGDGKTGYKGSVDPWGAAKEDPCILPETHWDRNLKSQEQPPRAYRTNSIQDFCFITDTSKAADEKIIKPIPLYKANETNKCYPPDKKINTLSHSAGKEDLWVILEHLSGHFAQSFQPYDDFPFVSKFFTGDDKVDNPYGPSAPLNKDGKIPVTNKKEYLQIDQNFTSDGLPSKNAPNPYFVEVTGISVNGELLQNWLHFRIFANLSVALGKWNPSRRRTLHGGIDSAKDKNQHEVPNYVTGKISAALIMIKDQDGWPVGDFSVPLPCSKTCTKYSHDVYYGDEKNALPCSYTPPYANSHPGMFVFDVDPGRYCTHKYKHYKRFHFPFTTTVTPTPPTTTTIPGIPAPKPKDPRDYPFKKRLEGVREVHATWSFGHSTCNFVQRLYIQTLIFEDVETVYPANVWPTHEEITPAPPTLHPTARHTTPSTTPKPKRYKSNVLFGWSAQYNIIKTTRSTLGGPDYVDLKYLRSMDKRKDIVDCHVPLWDHKDAVPSGFQKFLAPSHGLMLKLQANPPNEEKENPLPQVQVPSRQSFLGHLTYMYKRLDHPERRYYGSYSVNYTKNDTWEGPVCRPLPSEFLLSDTDKKAHRSKEHPEPISNFLLAESNRGIRCPCPLLPSTPRPKDVTPDPDRLYGRILHAEHMSIAYMLLTPIACFVARYYKETFITLFCFQEYWWYMWHVVLLFTACMFNVGALVQVMIHKDKTIGIRWYEPPVVEHPQLFAHYVLGVMSVGVFYLECVTGFFRSSDPKVRLRNIFTHWLIGCLNNACAIGSMIAMAWVKDSGYTCQVAYTSAVWIVFVITCYVIMELNSRKTDKKLRLMPKRRYLPPPMKRLFTREPPGRVFRLMMLLIFILGLILLEALVIYFLRQNVGAESIKSCYETLADNTPRGTGDDGFDEEGGEEGDEDVTDPNAVDGESADY